jgi:hypothetical protein
VYKPPDETTSHTLLVAGRQGQGHELKGVGEWQELIQQLCKKQQVEVHFE